MTALQWVLASVMLGFFLLLPIGWNLRFLWFYSRRRATAGGEKTLPRAAVLLPLRGADPSLRPCLAGLLRQDYPDYYVHIVVDSRDDPAWDLVHALLREHGQGTAAAVRVEVLERPLETCSLKVSAQLQAIARLDEAVGVVAMIDADSVPAPGWLRSMATPLLEPGVGAATGIRWFAPPDDRWGSLVRHCYNAASIPQMYFFDLPWGGALAFRADVLRHSRLPRHWARCFCEDESCGDVLRELKLKLAFVPAATHVNRESIGLRSCNAFLLRQLLCLRLHHRSWPVIMACNLGVFLAQVTTLGLAGNALYHHDWNAAALWAGLIGMHGAGTLACLAWAERAVRRVLAERGEPLPPPIPSYRTLPAAMLTQWLAIGAMLHANFLRQVDWRGVAYSIDGKDSIRLMEYRPYAAALPVQESVV